MEAVKDARHKNHNKKKPKVYIEVDIKKEIKDGIQKEHLASNNKKKENIRSTNYVNLVNYQDLCALDSKDHSLSDYGSPIIKSIGRLAIKLFGSSKLVDIIKK